MDDHAFPWTELVISCGFFLIYLVEEIVHYALCVHSGHAHHASENRTIRSCATNPYEPNRRDDGHGHVHGGARAPTDPVVPKFSLERSVELARTDVTTTYSGISHRYRRPENRAIGNVTERSSSLTTLADTWTAIADNGDEDAATASFASKSVDSAVEAAKASPQQRSGKLNNSGSGKQGYGSFDDRGAGQRGFHENRVHFVTPSSPLQAL
jgi:hypothetical protein